MDSAQRIILIDSNNLLSTAVKRHIENEIGLPCAITDHNLPSKLHPSDIALINADAISANELSQLLGKIQNNHLCSQVAVYNLTDDHQAHQIIRWPIIKGIFTASHSLDLLVIGIQTILRGRHWFSRGHAEILASLRAPPCSPVGLDTPLTEREKDILSLISSGLPNAEIANQLALSPHTVKTHLYNVYKKLGIRNRSQAVRWTQANGFN